MIRRALVVPLTLVFTLTAAPAWACGGLIGPRGNVNLLRTTTFVGYAGGIEHYVTSFTFTGGGGGRFGSLVPLPGIPTTVERGGDWTLQRLVREVSPPEGAFAAAKAEDSSRTARVILETRIDALDITVLEGGADEVGRWAADNGFILPPDSPEVLRFYAERSPIFMAARFDADAARARGQLAGDGTPIHLTIPTDDPWVPLRILALGKSQQEPVEADVFLLTERNPVLLPAPVNSRERYGLPRAAGMRLLSSGPASAALLDDLRSDKGMGWIPDEMHLTAIALDADAGSMSYDLAVAAGSREPSWRAAGLGDGPGGAGGLITWVLLGLVALAVALTTRRPFSRAAAA